MESKHSISVCMPMFNASRYLRESIDSVLAQTFADFEFLIADDGSTDNSVAIVESYSDPRIRLIKRPHDYIATLNCLLAEARGKYIARMDADDVMTEDRLRAQYSYMEEHQDIDIMFGGIELISENGDRLGQTFCTNNTGFITLSEISEGCHLAHPTAFIRASSISSKKYMLYNPHYVYAEDYNLWVELLIDGLILYNSGKIFGYYRRHAQQVSVTNYDEQMQKSQRIRERALAYQHFLTNDELHRRINIPQTTNKLTVVIPFLNEREEVKNTIESIRSTVGSSVDIIVVNDNSDRDYDYACDLSSLNVTCVTNSYRIGAALSKEKGVSLVKTPYFLILDAHMRLYSSDWADSIIAELEENPRRLLCCQTLALKKEVDGSVIQTPDVRAAHGAYVSYDIDSYIPGINWNNSYSEPKTGKPISIPCVLGAGYASSKAYWDKIAGMKGLQHYGCEEVFISTKAWKEGGGCYLLPRVIVGHIYRDKFPYPVHTSQYVYNYLLIAETLFPTSEQCFAHAVAWKLNKGTYFKTIDMLRLFTEEIVRLKVYFSTWNGNSYESIKQFNTACAKCEGRNQTIKREDANSVIAEILNPLQSAPIIGIVPHMAALIGLLAYAKSSDDASPGIETKYTELWISITEGLTHCNDYSFSSGLAGVGWMLIFATEHGLIEDDITPELDCIDKQISTCAPARITDLSIISGLGGIYAYAAARWGFNKRHNLANKFNSDFLEELTGLIPSVLSQTTDWRTVNFALQLSKRNTPDLTILRPELNEVIDVSKSIPSNPTYWTYSLDGVLGAVINHYLK